jgi:thymidylate kinase
VLDETVRGRVAGVTATRRVAGVTATRREVLDAVVAAVRTSGARWGWQGAAGARDRWLGATDAADLDLWVAADGRSAVDDALDALPSARVADAHDPRRLQHVSRAVETADGLAVVDTTFGDLRVGPVLLLPGAAVRSDGAAQPQLTGVAAAADLLVRPLLRARIPEAARVEQARAAWAAAEPVERADAGALWAHELGAGLSAEIVAVLDGATPEPGLATRARRLLLRRTVAPAGVTAAWSQRHAVLPAGRSAGPLGLRTRGVVVVLVGTDGSGKSTVADGLADRLHRCGFATRSAYFGMARGNLPGVSLARRLLGVAAAGDGAPTPPAAAPPAAMPAVLVPATGPDDAPPADAGDPRAGLDHPGVRRLAAWYYAAEYCWRYVSTVSPGVRRREIVICDRYVYDLRESPWPGSLASRVAEAVIPAPDVVALPDAPDGVIHARKPERSPQEQAAQQDRFRALAAGGPARVAEVVVDTSGADDDGIADLVAAVVTAAHRPRRARRVTPPGRSRYAAS